MGETANFRWNDQKDAYNQQKHGLPLRFVEAIFASNYIGIPTRYAVSGELRHMLTGKVSGRVLTCGCVWDGAKRRVMSLRPASRRERRAYQAEVDAGRDCRGGGAL